MVQVVYIDVLFTVNLIIDYFILLATSGILHRQDKKLRIFLGAAVGAVYSIFIFFPQMGFLYSSLLKLGISVVIVAVSFRFNTFKSFLKLVIVFYIISFLFGGIIFAVYLFVAPSGMAMRNGIVYFNISPVVLILSGAACYIIITLVARLTSHTGKTGDFYEVTIETDGKSASVKAFLDTGNNLADMLTGMPVMITEFAPVAPLVPCELADIFKTGAMKDPAALAKSAWAGRFHMVPYGSVGSSGGLLPAFRPDRIVVASKNEMIALSGVLVAVSRRKLNADGRYHALLGPLIFSTGCTQEDNLKIRK